MTLLQNNTITFLTSIFDSGNKIYALPGYTDEYTIGSTYTRWGRVQQPTGQTDGFALSFATTNNNMASIQCTSWAKVPCTGNVIFQSVETPRSFSKKYGCDYGGASVIDCSKEMNI